MPETQLLVECSKNQHVEIENICVERNCSISQYLIGLHEQTKEHVEQEKEKEPDHEQEKESNNQELVKRGRKKKVIEN